VFERVGTYYYFFPTFNQGRKVLWDGLDRDGFRFMDHFPPAVIDGKPNDTEMRIRFKNGSIFQIIGTDRINSLMGTNPIGCVFSEYALQSPKAWDYVRPILTENGGWAVFNGTPRGMNHFWDIYQVAQTNNWFHQLLTAEDTGYPSKEEIERERREGMPEEMIRQEFLCDWASSLVGSYYGKVLKRAREEGRVGRVPFDSDVQVHTFWDLGMNDANAIIFCQIVGREPRIIDCYESSGEGLSHYAAVLKKKSMEHGYQYAAHHFPHDVEVRELGTGKSRLETVKSLGLIPAEIAPNLPVEDGINAVRSLIETVWIDEEKCKDLLSALASYSKDWDDKARCFRSHPKHDWSSNYADSVRYMAVSLSVLMRRTRPPFRTAAKGFMAQGINY